MACFEIVKSSILEVPADTIVNPANSHLRHGGGLARVIDEAATKWPDSGTVRGDGAIDAEYRERIARIERYREENAQHPLIPTGSAGWTSAGALPYEGIVHAVGPIWGGGNYCEAALLHLAYYNALGIASAHGCARVALPAISAGIFGVPINVAEAAISAVRQWLPAFDRITIALLDDEHMEAFTRAAR